MRTTGRCGRRGVPELAPGVLSTILARIAVQAEAQVAAALEPVALAVEREAKLNASHGEHPRGTPTPAAQGSGPARVSGTLVRSITHSPVAHDGTGWETRVGTSAGLYAPYNRRTPSSLYGYYLEVSGAGRSHARYPFLLPAFDSVVKAGVTAEFIRMLATAWI
jgi:hypothetical protein